MCASNNNGPAVATRKARTTRIGSDLNPCKRRLQYWRCQRHCGTFRLKPWLGLRPERTPPKRVELDCGCTWLPRQNIGFQKWFLERKPDRYPRSASVRRQVAKRPAPCVAPVEGGARFKNSAVVTCKGNANQSLVQLFLQGRRNNDANAASQRLHLRERT